VAAEGLEHLADEAFGRPVRQPDAAAGAAHARHLDGRLRVVGGEHHPEGRQHGIEARIGERQGFDIGDLEAHVQALGARALGTAVEQAGDVVGRGHCRAAAGRGERGVAVAGGDVEHALVGAQVGGFGERFADDLQRGADDGVVAAGPGRSLAVFQGDEVGGGGHGWAP
jgi:hypothetical protein